MKYKMILVDMDGTLLDDEKNISEENVEVFKHLQEKGMIIGIATGRRFSFATFPTTEMQHGKWSRMI